jgi:hypothetical protein
MNQVIRPLLSAYVQWVTAYPIISAMIQFAILGTLGEIVSKWIIRKSFKYPFSFALTLWKMIVWAILAVGIKYAFKGHTAMVAYLVEHQMLPPLDKFGTALAISVSLNTQFGLLLVIMHRVLTTWWKSTKTGLDCTKHALPALVLDSSPHPHLYADGQLPDRPGGLMVCGSGIDFGDIQP